MFKRYIIIIWISLLFFVWVIPSYSGALDGKTFIGKNGVIGESGSEDDEIRFQDGKFFSVGCGKYGFGESAYTTKVEGNKVFFTADIYSDKYGRITYSGFVKGDDLQSTFIWFDKGKYAKPEQVKWWKGSAKK